MGLFSSRTFLSIKLAFFCKVGWKSLDWWKLWHGLLVQHKNLKGQMNSKQSGSDFVKTYEENIRSQSSLAWYEKYFEPKCYILLNYVLKQNSTDFTNRWRKIMPSLVHWELKFWMSKVSEFFLCFIIKKNVLFPRWIIILELLRCQIEMEPNKNPGKVESEQFLSTFFNNSIIDGVNLSFLRHVFCAVDI